MRVWNLGLTAALALSSGVLATPAAADDSDGGDWLATGVNGVDGAPGASGADGVGGLPGANGASGADGLAGLSGLFGANGFDGFPGSPGSLGSPGASGADGGAGWAGLVGSTGIDGFAGSPGAHGANGADGLNGLTGANGIAGLNGGAGVNGVAGVDGADGLAGFGGANGANGGGGFAGANGALGGSGQAGAPGANGSDGALGLAGASGTAGAAGVSGVAGRNGIDGRDGRDGRDGFARRMPVATAYAPPLTASEDTCSGSSSGGAQAMGIGFSVGRTWHDDNCRRIKNARELAALGYRRAAVQLLCVDDEVRQAMRAAGTPCPIDEPPAVLVPISEPAPRVPETPIRYDIFFDFDSARLKPESDPALQNMLATLQADPTANVEIEGHTDWTGADAYNLGLSQRRAQSVVEWLVAHGIARERLTAVGKGESEPVDSNETRSGRAHNRRVEVSRRS